MPDSAFHEIAFPKNFLILARFLHFQHFAIPLCILAQVRLRPKQIFLNMCISQFAFFQIWPEGQLGNQSPYEISRFNQYPARAPTGRTKTTRHDIEPLLAHTCRLGVCDLHLLQLCAWHLRAVSWHPCLWEDSWYSVHLPPSSISKPAGDQ
jgi:hypothetical protein